MQQIIQPSSETPNRARLCRKQSVCAVKSNMEPVKRERRYSIQEVATHFFPKRLDRDEVRGFVLFGMLTFSAHAYFNLAAHLQWEDPLSWQEMTEKLLNELGGHIG